MAFKVTGYMSEQGVPAEHHVIAQITLNKINETGTIEVNAYYVSDYRHESGEPIIQPIKRLWYDVRPDSYKNYFSEESITANGWNNLYEASYHWLKNNINIYTDALNI